MLSIPLLDIETYISDYGNKLFEANRIIKTLN